MADQVKMRGGSESSSNNFTGAAREVTVDTTLWTLRVHDGVTPGGHKLLKSGNCLVVEEADVCDPTKPTCKVSINGDLEVSGDVVIDGSIDLPDLVLDLETDDLKLKNPGTYNADCNVSSGTVQTQADANKWFYEGIRVLDTELCKAQASIIALEKQYQDLEARVDQNEIDIAAIKAEIANLKQEIVDIENAIKILEQEIENNQNSIEQNQIDIAKLQVQMEFVLKGLELLNDRLDDLKLNDLSDVEAYAADGNVLTFDATKELWVAKEPVQIDSGVNIMGFTNVADPVSGSPQPGDTWIEHDPNVTRNQRADDDFVIAHSSWIGIAGEKIYEGEYVIFSTDNEWHRGGGIHDVTQVNSDWDELDPNNASYILNKPDIDKKIEDALKDPNNVGNGKLTIKDSDGATVGTFTANQVGDTDVSLPKGFSGDYGDLDNVPTEFPPSNHTHSYNDLTDKPSIGNGKITINQAGVKVGEFTVNQTGASTVNLTDTKVDAYTKAQSDARFMPLDIRTLQELS